MLNVDALVIESATLSHPIISIAHCLIRIANWKESAITGVHDTVRFIHMILRFLIKSAENLVLHGMYIMPPNFTGNPVLFRSRLV